MVKINIKKTIKIIKVNKVIGNLSHNIWYNGKLYTKISSFSESGKKKITNGISFNNKKFYTIDKKRRVSGFAPPNLLP